MSTFENLMLFAGSLVVGYFCFLVILKILPARLTASNHTQKAEVLAEAKKQADFILTEAQSTNSAKNQMLLEELDETLADKQEDLKLTEENLNIMETRFNPSRPESKNWKMTCAPLSSTWSSRRIPTRKKSPA